MGTCSDAAKSLLNNGIVIILVPEEEEEEEISVASNTTGEKLVTAPSIIPGGGTPYDSLYVEAPPERGIFFRPQVYQRIGNFSFGCV